MICEKCGKKIADKKPYCDYCKHPVVYSGFSKPEYEKTVAPVDVPVSAATDMERPRYVVPPEPPEKKKSRTALILVGILALVAVVTVVWLVTPKSSDKGKIIKDTGEATKPRNEVTITEEEPKITIESINVAGDAKILVYDVNSAEPRYDYELVIKKGEKVTTEGLSIISLVFEEIVLEKQINDITDAKTMANIEGLAVGDRYRIIVTDTNDTSITKEIEVVVVETGGSEEVRIELGTDKSEPEETKNPAQPYLQILNDCTASDEYMLCNIGDEVKGLIIRSGKDYKVYAIVNDTAKEIAEFTAEKLFMENEFETLLFSDGDKYYEITKDGKREKEDFNELMATQISDSEFISVGNTSKIDNYNKEN